MPPWPALNCSWPVVTSATGCDFIQAAPPDVQAQIERIVGHFRSDRRFHTSAVKHVLDGSTRIEQKRLKIRLTVLWSTLERLKPTQSAIVELGTFVGTMAMGMRMVMDTLGYRYPEHVLHVSIYACAARLRAALLLYSTPSPQLRASAPYHVDSRACLGIRLLGRASGAPIARGRTWAAESRWSGLIGRRVP